MKFSYITKILVLILFALLIMLKGLYYANIYSAITVCYLGFTIWQKWEDRNITSIAIILLICAFIFPNTSVLWGWVALIMGFHKELWGVTILCLLLWSIELLVGWSPIHCWQIIGLMICSIPLYFIRKQKIKNIIFATLSIICLIMTIVRLPYFREDYVIENYEGKNSAFAPSNVFLKITETEYAESDKQNNIVRSQAYYTKVNEKRKGVLITEVTTKDTNEIITNEIWQQPVSWHDNLLIGDQYYIEAIRHDGGLWSNKGKKLKETGIVKLAYCEGLIQSQPLIEEVNDVLYCHDSDWSSSYLANYQSGFLREMFSTRGRPNFVRIINVLFLLILCSFYIRKQSSRLGLQLMFVIGLITSLYYANIYKGKGDIRLVGKIVNSHENNSFNGVVKNIVEDGYDYTIGERNCEVLVVQEGNSAKWKGEIVVIAEPEATVTYNGKKMEVEETPMGNMDGIKDARYWTIDGETTNNCTMDINGIKFIATGSPADLEWKSILK